MSNHWNLKHFMPVLFIGSTLAIALYFWFIQRIRAYAIAIFRDDE